MSTEDLGGRLPLVDVNDLQQNQRDLLSYLEDSKFPWADQSGFRSRLPDGRAIGPFNVYLHSPEMGRAFNVWVDAESAHSTLSAQVRQVVILTVGAGWHAAYEVYAHTAVARSAQVDEHIIDAIVAGSEPSAASPQIVTAWRFTNELVAHRSVSAQTYQDAKAIFGDRDLVDMIHLIGLYLATSALLNAFDIPAPEQ